MSNYKIGVCYLSIGERYKEMTKYSRINKIDYCNKHGYTFIEDESIYDKTKPIPWSKLLLLSKYLSDYDYLVWVDADILIMNSDTTIESYIEKYENYNIICGSDWKMTNTGFMIIKNCSFSKNFLRKVYYNVYDPLGDGERYQNWEQGSFIHLFDNNYMNCKSKIKITHPYELNSYWFNYYPGHFVLHFAGVRGELVEKVIKKHYPGRMEEDTDESYNSRIEWLSGPIRAEADEILRIQREENVEVDLETHRKNSDINIVTDEEYNKVLNDNNYIIDTLLEIVKNTGEELEGNCFYQHKSFNFIEENNKRINLFSVGKYAKNILEIGFNAGHSTLLFLLSNPDCVVYCFDICEHTYTKPCFEYLSKLFPNRMILIEGDSIAEVNNFKSNNPDIKFDIIHIDGNHDPRYANLNFFSTLTMSKKDGFLIFDDIYIPSLRHLWEGYKNHNHIKEVKILPVKVYPHVIGKYVNEQS